MQMSDMFTIVNYVASAIGSLFLFASGVMLALGCVHNSQDEKLMAAFCLLIWWLLKD